MSEQKKIVDEVNGSNWVISVSIILVLFALIGYYALATESVYVRLGVLFGCIALAIGLMAVTPNGKAFIEYAKDSIVEVKKVVWPTRKESTQMTLIVFGFVAIMSIFLWSTDKIAEWLIFSVFLGWK